MCGICGVLYKDTGKRVEPSVLIRMRDTIVHRGPDDCGLYINKNLGLAHRRLSIIDISGGHQPMSNEDETIWIAYNGEIYNFKDIKKELIKKGHLFKSNSDTEVVIHAYEEYEFDCVNKFNGMFAFALWDSKKKLLFLARDRLGIKPLYYAIYDDKLIFSSEIKAILAYKNFPCEVNTEAIKEYLIFRFIPGSNTLFKNIFSLQPGHILICKDSDINNIRIKKYWDIDLEDAEHVYDETTAILKLESLLEDSVKKRLISDVPLGTFNSGGLDSSLITALVCKFKKEPVHTFSVGFYEKDFDETYYARLLSEKYKTIHHEIRVDGQTFARLLPKMIYHNDGPLCFPNSILIYCVSKMAKDYVSVVLTGEGADELFSGYPRYFIPRLWVLLRKIPCSIMLLKLINMIAKDHRVKKLIENLSMNQDLMLLSNSSFVSPRFIENIFKIKINAKKFPFRYEQLQIKKMETLTKLFYLDLKTYLLAILARQDKMSMAASIESRVPYLDHRIVEYSYKVSPRLKQKRWQTKYLLKKYAERYLLPDIVYRSKSGFGVPLDRWFSDPSALGRYLGLLYNSDFLCLGQDDLKNIVENSKTHYNIYEFLWGLINLELWYRIFIGKNYYE